MSTTKPSLQENNNRSIDTDKLVKFIEKIGRIDADKLMDVVYNNKDSSE